MKLVLVRHLATAWNREGRLQGRRDIPVEPVAESALPVLRERAESIAQYGPFDHVMCSTLQRTRQTAELFGYPEAELDPLLDELNFGPWEGAPRSEFIALHGEAWLHAPETLALGETVTSLAERILAFVNKRRELRAVLVFGHGAWIRAARALHETGKVTTMNLRDVGNSEVIVLEYDKRSAD